MREDIGHWGPGKPMEARARLFNLIINTFTVSWVSKTCLFWLLISMQFQPQVQEPSSYAEINVVEGSQDWVKLDGEACAYSFKHCEVLIEEKSL